MAKSSHTFIWLLLNKFLKWLKHDNTHLTKTERWIKRTAQPFGLSLPRLSNTSLSTFRTCKRELNMSNAYHSLTQTEKQEREGVPLAWHSLAMCYKGEGKWVSLTPWLGGKKKGRGRKEKKGIEAWCSASRLQIGRELKITKFLAIWSA